METYASDYLHQPQELKYLLAPLIARSEQEQQTFYSIFDQYLAKASQWEAPVIEGNQAPPAYPNAWWPLGILGIILLAIFYFSQSKEDPIWGIVAPLEAVIGDTISIRNAAAELDLDAHRYLWTLEDKSNNSNTVELQDSQLVEWRPLIESLGASPDKVIRLRILERSSGKELHQSTHDLTIVCPVEQRPEILAIRPMQNEKIRPGERISFQADIAQEGPFAYEWKLRDSVVAQTKVYTGIFAAIGKYNLSLKLTDTTSLARCESKKDTTFNVQNTPEPLALLSTRPLIKDTFDLVSYYTPWLWWLLLLPLLWSVYSWWKWWQQKKLAEAAAEKAKEELVAAAIAQKQNKKGGPYTIPFNNHNQYIQSNQSALQLADALRQRQEGRRQQLDVGLSLEATIAQGGFPSPRFSFNQQATEYLFLLDRQSPDSHQFELFLHLVQELHRQEAYIEAFYYDKEFYRFWNQYHPEGIGLEVLQRNYPGHRLVILGDGHALLDPAGSGLPAIRTNYATALRNWKQRLLLSPLPPKSWTYRERLLDHLFAIFPADLQGLDAAAQFIESDLDQEDLPPVFQEWQNQLAKVRDEADTNYRDWEDIEELEDHFSDRPDLFRWLCALAVYPKPNWSLTILIGQALANQGVIVNYDNLLQLARVEWLQTGILDDELRHELLTEADADSLRLARRAVKEELESIGPLLTPNSHAAAKLNAQQVILDFELDPDAPKTQQALQVLLEQNQLSPRQMIELNQYLKQHLADQGRSKQSGDIRQFVASQEIPPEEEEQTTSFVNPYLWSALAATMLFTMMALYLSISNPPNSSSSLAELRVEVDSAVLLNNQGVDFYYQHDVPFLDSLMKGGSNALANDEIAFFQAESLFYAALKNRPDYATASNNISNGTYNGVVQYYNGILQSDLWDRQLLSESLPDFKEAALKDAFRLDSWHALGLIHYYTNQEQTTSSSTLDSAYIYYDSLANTNYFDTLSLYPNLETLLNLRSRIRSVQTNWQDNSLDLLIDYTSNAAGTPLELRAMLIDKNRALLSGTKAVRKDIAGDGARIDQITLPSSRIRRIGTGDSILVWIYNTEEKLPVVEYTLAVPPKVANTSPRETVQTRLPSGLMTNQNYCVLNIPKAVLVLRNRVLNREEMDLLNLKATSTAGKKLSDETQIRTLRLGDTLRLIGENTWQYEVQFRGNSGFISKIYKTNPTIGTCTAAADLVVSNTLKMSGSILEVGSSKPLSGVAVILLPRTVGDTHPRDQLRTETDEQGYFEIPGLHSDSRYELRLAKEGYGISGNPSIRSGSDWNAKPVEERMTRLNQYFEVKGTILDAETGLPVSGALLTIIGDGFSKGSNTDEKGQFQETIQNADIETRSLNIVVVKRGYKDSNSSVNNYSSGSALLLNIFPEKPRLLVDITRYPDENGAPRDSLRTDHDAANNLIDGHRAALEEQGRLGGLLARRALLEFALEDYSAAPRTATEALTVFSRSKITDHRDIPLLEAMPDLISLKKRNVEIQYFTDEYIADNKARILNSKASEEAWLLLKSNIELHLNYLKLLESVRRKYSRNAEANVYLLKAQMEGTAKVHNYIEQIQNFVVSNSRVFRSKNFQNDLFDYREEYRSLYSNYKSELDQYSAFLKGR